MATPDQIPTDLTLEIEGDATPEQFVAAARAFFGCVEETARAITPEEALPRWRVKVREGSNLIALEPPPTSRPALIQAVCDRLVDGIAQLAGGNLQASRLPEAALTHLKNLSEISCRQAGPIPMRIWVKRKPISVSQEIARVIREDWRADYRDYGTVEGRLTAIQDQGSLRLLLKDDRLKQSVRCYVPEEQLPQAFAAFRRRVEVDGVIHYRRNGVPISVDAEHIEILPDDDDLPSAADVRGLLKAAG